jgi:hypothetical protein
MSELSNRIIVSKEDVPKYVDAAFAYDDPRQSRLADEGDFPELRVYVDVSIDGTLAPNLYNTDNSLYFDEKYRTDAPDWEQKLAKDLLYFFETELHRPYKIHDRSIVQKIVKLAKEEVTV